MKTVEDFRRELGEPDQSFVDAVKETMNQLGNEDKDKAADTILDLAGAIWESKERKKGKGRIRSYIPSAYFRVVAACLVIILLMSLMLLTKKKSDVVYLSEPQDPVAIHNLPIVYLTVNEDDLWNAETGMLTEGEQINKTVLPYKNALYRETGKIPRKCQVTIKDIYDTTVIETECEIALLLDGLSVDMYQKPFVLSGCFSTERQSEHKSILLSNGGKDCIFTRLMNGYISNLVDSLGSTVLHLQWQPVSVFLNGEYWGHYNLTENVDASIVAIHERLEDSNGITVLRGKGYLVDGSTEGSSAYRKMISDIKKMKPTENTQDLEYLQENIDIDNYLEYMALEMFFGNSDTASFCCYRIPGGKWKWLLQGTEYCLFDSGYNSPKAYMHPDETEIPMDDNTILLTLLSVPEYKDQFLRILGRVFQTLTTDRMLDVLNPIIEQISPEMPRHFERWAAESGSPMWKQLPTESQAALEYWNNRIDRLKNVIRKRPSLLWEFVQDEFELTNEEMLQYFGNKPEIQDDTKT